VKEIAVSYTKQTWVDGTGGGTPRSAARLAHQEDGIKEASDRLDVLEPATVADRSRAVALALVAAG
jgi:hypothetical protein